MCVKPDPERPTWDTRASFRKDNWPDHEYMVFDLIASDCLCGNVIVRLPNNNVWVETI